MLWVPLALGLLVAAGCGGSGTENPATYPVSGTVTLDGKAVAGATVTFVPEGGSGGHPAGGTTDQSGQYTLTTFAGGDGAVPGKYQVKIVKFESAAPAGASGAGSGSGSAIPEDANYAPPGDADAAPVADKNVLPEKYADPTRSGFTVEVTDGENTGKDFKLVSG
jgi:hypothetical protein